MYAKNAVLYRNGGNFYNHCYSSDSYYEKVGNKENKTPRKYVYDIPESWRWKKLGELIFSNVGLTYKPTNIDISGVPVLRANNIKNGSGIRKSGNSN